MMMRIFNKGVSKFAGRHIILLLLCILLVGNNLSFAQQDSVLYTGDPNNLIIEDPQSSVDSSNMPKEYSEEEAKNMELLFKRYQEEMINGWESKTIYTQARLIKGKRDLEKNLEIFSSSDQKIQEYQNILKPLEQKIQSLQEQLTYLNEQMGLTEYKVTNVGQQIIEKQEQIKRNMEDIERATLEVQHQEKTLIEYVRLIYNHEQQYYDLDTQSLNDLKLLLADQPISKTITSGEYMTIIQRAGRDILDELKGVYTSLAEKEIELEVKEDRLHTLKDELEKQQKTLRAEQFAKGKLLEITQGDEQKYQDLLLETEREKQQSADEIQLLQDSIQTIEQQLEELKGKTQNIDEESLRKKAESAAELLGTTSPDAKIHKFPWPVDPKEGLSAYFEDANYVKVFGVGHGAVDIPTNQGTEIQAPADAYVYKAKDNDYGYNYIILAHRGGFLTLYGHVSKLLVKEGDLVRKGDIIGLSGGAPGTPGAGWRTTGPHLHLEVWKDGKKVNPLLYLDLTKLPTEKVIASQLPKQQEEVNLDD